MEGGLIVELPVDQLSCLMSNPPDALTDDLRRRVRRGWPPTVFENDCDSVNRRLWDELAISLVIGVYYKSGFQKYKRGVDLNQMTMKHGIQKSSEDEALAIFTMWILEESHRNPWKVVRLFVKNLLGPPEPFPHQVDDMIPGGCKFVILVDALHGKLKGARRSGMDMVLICNYCGHAKTSTVPLFLCTCKEVRYCSKGCQDADWDMHKADCREARGSGSVSGSEVAP